MWHRGCGVLAPGGKAAIRHGPGRSRVTHPRCGTAYASRQTTVASGPAGSGTCLPQPRPFSAETSLPRAVLPEYTERYTAIAVPAPRGPHPITMS